MAKGCVRCGGQVLRNYGEEGCLQCGYDPTPIDPPVTIPVRPSSNGRRPVDSTRILSSSPSQIRRRRRRLLAKGYSEKEAQETIKAQIGEGSV